MLRRVLQPGPVPSRRRWQVCRYAPALDAAGICRWRLVERVGRTYPTLGELRADHPVEMPALGLHGSALTPAEIQWWDAREEGARPEVIALLWSCALEERAARGR